MSRPVIAPVAFDSPPVTELLAEWDARLPPVVRAAGPVVRASDFAAPSGVFLLARVEGAPLGCAGLRRIGPAVGELKRLYVRPGARGGGIGRALVREVEAHAARLGYRELRLDTHSAGLAGLFERVGFHAIPDYNGNPNARHWLAKMLAGSPGSEAAARSWWWARQLSVCEESRPWARGAVVRSHRHPAYYELNKVIVERAAGASASELADEVDALLSGAAHRRLDILELAEAARLRPELEALGYRAMALSLMRHEAPPEVGVPELDVREVEFDAVRALRRAWHVEEDLGGGSFDGFYPSYREVARARSARVLAVCERERPVGYAQLEGSGAAEPGVEVGEVYVDAGHRGRGLGTALTAAAIVAARDRGEVWIGADAEDRPWHLYERLGFRRAWGLMEFVRPPR